MWESRNSRQKNFRFFFQACRSALYSSHEAALRAANGGCQGAGKQRGEYFPRAKAANGERPGRGAGPMGVPVEGGAAMKCEVPNAASQETSEGAFFRASRCILSILFHME